MLSVPVDARNIFYGHTHRKCSIEKSKCCSDVCRKRSVEECTIFCVSYVFWEEMFRRHVSVWLHTDCVLLKRKCSVDQSTVFCVSYVFWEEMLLLVAYRLCSIEEKVFRWRQHRILCIPTSNKASMGWPRLVGSIKLWVSCAEYNLFYRALLQKRHIILSILLFAAAPYRRLLCGGSDPPHKIIYICTER